MSNDWFQIINDESLEQGDILEEIDVLVPTIKFLMGETNEINAKTYNVLILSQTCDLTHKGKTPWVQVTPIHLLSTLKESHDLFKDDNNLEAIRRGIMPKYHMINECDIAGSESEISLIDFREVFTLPYDYVANFVKFGKSRRRINSPYKEHLAQAFAKFIMRVGLPADIPPFK